MPLVINTNVSSLTAQRNLTNNTNALSKSYERLSSGFRINRSSDDAAGLQISETLRSQIRGSSKALENTQDGINVLNIVDGALATVTEHLQRIRELAVQAANDTNATNQKTAIAQEINARLSEISRIANTTQFNGVTLLNASRPSNYYLEVGPNATSNDVIDIASALVDTTYSDGLGWSLAYYSSGNFNSNTTIRQYLSGIDTLIGTINSTRSTVGSFVNRLEGTASNLSIAVENLQATESRIRNVDVAAESAQLVRNQILQQAASSILAQANQSPSLALSLLRGQ